MNNKSNFKKEYRLEQIIANLLENLDVKKSEWELVVREINNRYNDAAEKIELPKLKEEQTQSQITITSNNISFKAE